MDKFLVTHQAAGLGKLAGWEEEADSALALVIVLDQFPRNMFRGTARAFATDRPALAAATAAVEQGFDRLPVPAERTFFYLPFEHAEDIAAQRRSLEFFRSIDPDDMQWAKRHHDVIERFGRFPHRNALFGRASTPEEIEFLKQPGSSF